MAEREAIEYEFEDLRRNDDPLPPNVAAAFGLSEEDLDEEVETTGQDGDEDGQEGDDGDDDKMVPVSEVNRRVAAARRDSERRLMREVSRAEEVIGHLQKRVDKIESADEEGELQRDYDTKMADLQAQIDAAVEEGDQKKVNELTVQVSRLTAENVTKAEQLKSKQHQHDEPADLDADRRAAAVQRRANEWLVDQDWWDDPEFADAKRFVKRLDLKLQERGYDPTEDDFYEVLEQEVEKKYPGVVVKTMDGVSGGGEDDEFADIPDKRRSSRNRQRRAGRRAPVNPGGDGSTATGEGERRGGRRTKTLTRRHIANMRVFGMDPNNKEHVEAYLKEVD